MKKFFILLKALFLGLVKTSTSEKDFAGNDMDNIPSLLIFAVLILFLQFILGGIKFSWIITILLSLIWVIWYIIEVVFFYKKLSES